MKSAAKNTIYTIGHSTHSNGVFIEMLQSFKIELVADIRHYPGSRKFPQFNIENLQASLANVHIGNLHFPGLGGRRKVDKIQRTSSGITHLLEHMQIIWKRPLLKLLLKN